ncbi:hypothetical protein GGF43_003533 [Coemansia sp. RSA 2618]|nr:hypothetical protein GGF43_003533 [Coemansia sp. RSA 2618]
MQSSGPETAPAVYTDVTRENIQTLFSDISKQISRATFIAIDTEFTGLSISDASPAFGFNTAEWTTRSTDMRDMYKAMSNVAKTHALVSLGLSTFTPTSGDAHRVFNFNFLLQEQNTHLVNPASIAFLAQNGFDLGKQALLGIRYFSGPNPLPLESRSEDINTEGDLMRKVLFAMVRAKKPLVIHNGLFDLAYMYQSFFGPLPDSYESFVYDLTNMFPAGIYDTKFIAERLIPGTASYLAYLYHKSEREQKQRREQGSEALSVMLTKILLFEKPASEAKRRPLSEKKCQDKANADAKPQDQPEKKRGKSYCKHFAAFGHCKFKDQCKRSHDIHFILDCQEKERNEPPADSSPSDANVAEKQNGKRKRTDEDAAQPSKILKALSINKTNGSLDQAPKLKHVDSAQLDESSSNNSATAYHTAAYDAYMTGFIFGSLRIQHGAALDELKNRVYRMGRGAEPLLIQASTYASSSTTYKQTMKLIDEMPDSAFAGETTESEPSAN